MPFIKSLTALTSSETIKCLKLVFAVHGIAATLVSDNGPQFSSEQFKTFSKEWGFFQVTSSPHFP